MISHRRRPLILGSFVVPWLVVPQARTAWPPARPSFHAGVPAIPRAINVSLALGLSDTGTIVGSISLREMKDVGFAVRWGEGNAITLAPLPGDVNAAALDINGAGQAVGVSMTGNDAWHAVLWDNGEVIALLPDALTGHASGINSRGQIVGAVERGDGKVSTAVLWENGKSVALPPLPGDTDSQAWKINDEGQVVGQSWSEETGRAVLWDDGEPIALEMPPGHTWSLARSINDAGQVVGWSGNQDDGIQPVLWSDDEAVVLGSPSPGIVIQGRAFDLNNAGEVVGYVVKDDDAQHAALWRDGELIDLGALPGHPESTALAINDSGTIVGWSSSTGDDGVTQAVRWDDGEIVALEAPVVIVALDPFQFAPTELTVTPGQEVIAINIGILAHDFTVDDWSIKVDLPTGDPVTITIPEDAAPGDYEFYCSVPGHREIGMVGTLTIVEAEGEAAAPAEDEAATPAETTDEGAAAGPVSLEAQDPFNWSTNELEAAPGQVISITNSGFLEHNFMIDELSIWETLPSGEAVQVTLPDDLVPGDTYTYYCSIPGHRESGMEGTLTIVAPGQGSR